MAQKENIGELPFSFPPDNFECKQCGRCCREVRFLPMLEWEYENIRSYIRSKGLKLDSIPEKGCIFLKDNKCSIYEVRPYICRAFGNSYDACYNGVSPKIDFTSDDTISIRERAYFSKTKNYLVEGVGGYKEFFE